jgi:hypothetical protein
VVDPLPPGVTGVGVPARVVKGHASAIANPADGPT